MKPDIALAPPASRALHTAGAISSQLHHCSLPDRPLFSISSSSAFSLLYSPEPTGPVFLCCFLSGFHHSFLLPVSLSPTFHELDPDLFDVAYLAGPGEESGATPGKDSYLSTSLVTSCTTNSHLATHPSLGQLPQLIVLVAPMTSPFLQ